MPQGFSFSKKPDYEKRRAKGFRLPFFGTRQGGTGMAFAGSCKGQNGFAKERRRTKPFLKRPEGTLFCSLQFTRFSAERPCGTSSAAGPYGMPPPNMAQPCRTRYIINDLRRRPFFPPHMGCPARAPHPPLFRQTRQLSGCFRPPMRRLRAEMDAIAHARDNSRSVRRMPSMQAFEPTGALRPLPNPRLEHRPQLVRNPAFFSAAGKADAPLFYAR